MEGPRAVKQAEFNEALALANRVFRTGVDQNMSTDYPLVFSSSNLENLRVVLEDLRIISHAAMAERELGEKGCVLPISMICAMATDPTYRKRGAATKIIEDAIATMHARGNVFGLLWTGEARDFYRRLGWEVISSNGWAYLIQPDQASQFDQSLSVRSYQGGKDLKWIMKTYENHPSQVARTHSEYQKLFGLPKVRVWVAEEADQLEGYLVLAEAYNKSGVVEWGGSSQALSSLLSKVLSSGRNDPLQVFVPIGSNPMTDLLTTKGYQDRIPMEEADGCGLKMVRILSLKALFQKLSPHLQVQLRRCSGQLGVVVAETGERVSLEWDGNHITVGSARIAGEIRLSLHQAARFIFGPEKPSAIIDLPESIAQDLDRAFPFEFYIWMLDYV